jgi:hypothetical protein
MIVETLKNLEAAAPQATPSEPTAPAAQAPAPDTPPTPAAVAPKPPPAQPASDFRPVVMPGWAMFGLGLVAGVVVTILVESGL